MEAQAEGDITEFRKFGMSHDFKEAFGEWCSRAGGEFSAQYAEGYGDDRRYDHMACEIDGGVVEVDRQNVMPFSSNLHVDTVRGETSLTSVKSFRMDGTKLTVTGTDSRGQEESVDIGPDGWFREHLNDHTRKFREEMGRPVYD